MNSFDYTNSTLFGWSKGERWAGTIWGIFVLVSSLIGDSAILVASIKYKAFQLHKTVVTFIQHLAVCDLIVAVSYALPVVSSLIANRWPLNGPLVCYCAAYLGSYGYSASGLLICGMTLSKLLLLKYPLKARSWSGRKSHQVCAVIWLASLLIPICFLAVDNDDIYFDYRMYNCNYGFKSDVWKVLLPISCTLAGFIPNLTIVVSTVLVLKEARAVAMRTEEGLRWQGVLTVVLTAAIYTISILPFASYYILEPLVLAGEGLTMPNPYLEYYYRIACAFMNLNVITNFFVYCLTVSSFRKFISSRFQRALSSLYYAILSTGRTLTYVNSSLLAT